MYVTLNISATSIKLLAANRGKVTNWGKAPLAPGMVRDGLILQPAAVGAAIDALFKSKRVTKEQVITTLTGLTFSYRILSLPRLKPALFEEAIQRVARKEMPLPLEELYLTWQVVGQGHDEMAFIIFGVPRNPIDTVIQTLAIAGVKPYIMDLKPLALARAADRGDAIIADLAPDYFDIVLVTNGIPTIMRTIIPRGEGASLEDNIQRLTDELSKTVTFYNSSRPESPLSSTIPLLLAGELSSDATASQLIQAEIKYPIEPLVPPLKLPPDLPAALYAANLGLALKKMPLKTASKGEATHYHDVNLNIFRAKYRAVARPLRLRNILAPIALTLAIGLLFPFSHARSEAEAVTARLQTRLGTVSQELRTARLALDQARQIESAIGQIVVKANALQEKHQRILSLGRGFADNLESVTGALPPGARFTHIEIGATQITVEGEADNAFTVIRYVSALETEEAFSEVRIARLAEDAQAERQQGKTAWVSFTIVITKP